MNGMVSEGAGEAVVARVLGVVGSPRRGGNTETLVDEVLRGAEEAGATVEKVILSEMDVRPCMACNACVKNGGCVQEDGMRRLLDSMMSSGAWVLGTPVYWWGPTAQFKAFMDRWYGVNRDVFLGRRVVLVVPLGGGSEGYARHTVGMLRDVLSYVGAEHRSTLLATGTNGLGSVSGNRELIEAARAVGQEVVKV
jgi:multimeric flavodoxin WrbA